MSTTASPAFATGTGKSPYLSSCGPPCRSMKTAFMVNLPGSISLAQPLAQTPWPKLRGANLASAARVCVGQRPSVRAGLEQLDRHSLRTAQEGDAHPWPDGGGLHCELGALGLELGHDGVDFRHRQPAMVEALIGSLRWWIDIGVRQDLGHE